MANKARHPKINLAITVNTCIVIEYPTNTMNKNWHDPITDSTHALRRQAENLAPSNRIANNIRYNFYQMVDDGKNNTEVVEALNKTIAQLTNPRYKFTVIQ